MENNEEKKYTLKDILPEKISTEDIMKLIKKWVDFNEGNVIFFGRFITIDPEKMKHGPIEKIDGVDAVNPVGEDLSCAYGDKKLLEAFSHAMYDELYDSEDEFIDW